jgi:hypothetical protein
MSTELFINISSIDFKNNENKEQEKTRDQIILQSFCTENLFPWISEQSENKVKIIKSQTWEMPK